MDSALGTIHFDKQPEILCSCFKVHVTTLPLHSKNQLWDKIPLSGFRFL